MYQEITQKSAILINSMGAGGSERMVSILLQEAVRQKNNIYLICLEKDLFYALPPEIKIFYLFNGKLNRFRFLKFLLLPIFSFKLAKILKNNNIDIVQSHIYLSNFVNILTKIFFSNHKVIVVETVDIGFFKSKPIYLLFIKFLYNFVDNFIFKAELMAKNMEIFLNKKLNFTLGYNAYDLQMINEMKHESIHDFNFLPHINYLICVGRLETQKNHILCIHALSKLKNVDTELIIIGEGSCFTQLKLLSVELGLEKRVHILGKRQNPFKYIANSSVFILSSNNEGFPNVLVEAMACGTPVIATDCPSGPREILAPDTDCMYSLKSGIEITPHGILVPVNDLESMVNSITLLFADSSLRKNISENAIIRANDFDKRAIFEKYFSPLKGSA